MKSNFAEWLFNPFRRIAGIQAFTIGLLISALTAFIAAFSNTAFDGVLDMHLVTKLTMVQSFGFMVINIVSLVLVMHIAGFTVAKGYRFVDMLGTMTLSRFPFLFVAVSGFMAIATDLDELMANPFIILQNTGFLIMIIITLPFLMWTIVLMYRAFKTTTGASGNKLTATFIIGILIAEIISKVLIYLIFK